MFCRNCGKEIPNGINFCNHCGAAQNVSSSQDTQSFYQTNEAQQSTVDSQPMHAEPRPPKKKSKGTLPPLTSIDGWGIRLPLPTFEWTEASLLCISFFV